MSRKVKDRNRAKRNRYAAAMFERAAEDPPFREQVFLPWISTLHKPRLWGIEEKSRCQPS